EEKAYDVVIVGAGAAGMTAAIYTTRRNLKTVVLTKDVGGQTNTTNHIENYPGIDVIEGPVMMKKFEEQAIDFGAEIFYQGVEKIEKLGEKDFRVTTSEYAYRCKSVILAFGKTPKLMNVPGEIEFTNKGISYCVTCDGPLFKSKITAVVGNSHTALEGAEILSDICSKVYVIHKVPKFAGHENDVENLKKKGNVEFINASVKEAKGDKFLKSVVVQSMNPGETKGIEINGLFVELGFESKTDFVKDFVERDALKQIIINDLCETKTSGLFAAGDVTNMPFKQIVICAGDGAKAALQCYNYIKGLKTVISADWATLKKEKK
ncbi:MAG: FAD-dependent oxidoreductase, partial [Candidatus Aenigmarchaeota archaeon]|nr:FAD-dependent oxidoreductase [Candidatus Aenigmarchaeota archaeon]